MPAVCVMQVMDVALRLHHACIRRLCTKYSIYESATVSGVDGANSSRVSHTIIQPIHLLKSFSSSWQLTQ